MSEHYVNPHAVGVGGVCTATTTSIPCQQFTPSHTEQTAYLPVWSPPPNLRPSLRLESPFQWPLLSMCSSSKLSTHARVPVSQWTSTHIPTNNFVLLFLATCALISVCLASWHMSLMPHAAGYFSGGGGGNGCNQEMKPPSALIPMKHSNVSSCLDRAWTCAGCLGGGGIIVSYCARTQSVVGSQIQWSLLGGGPERTAANHRSSACLWSVHWHLHVSLLSAKGTSGLLCH